MKLLLGLVIVARFAAGQEPPGVRLAVSLARVLEESYHISCTTVLYGGDDAAVRRRAILIGEAMMKTYDAHGCVSIHSIRSYLALTVGNGGSYEDGCNRFFFLILGQRGSREEIAELSQRNGSGDVWLMFAERNASSLRQFFDCINAAYDMDLLIAHPLPEGRVLLSEVYRISMEHPVRVRDYGEWTEAAGLKLSATAAFYIRRQDLEGIVLKVATMHNPPSTLIVREETGEIRSVDGLFGRLWREMSSRLNFSSSYSLVENVGAPRKDNKWTGMTGMLAEGKMDVGLGYMAMTPNRCSTVHCLWPIISARNQLYFKNAGPSIQWSAILKPFHVQTWVSIIFWFAISSVFLNAFFLVGKRIRTEGKGHDFSLLNSCMTVYSALCQQGSPTTPYSAPCRVIFFSSYIVANILLTVYSASLISFIAVLDPTQHFQNIEDLLKDGSHSLQMLRNSDSYYFFANATDSFKRQVFQKLIAVIPHESQPRTSMEGLMRACNNDRIVYFGSEFDTMQELREVNANKECDLITLNKPLNLVHFSIALSRKLRFKDAFNFQINKLLSHGFLSQMMKDIWTETTDKTEEFTEVGLAQMYQVFAMLLLGIFCSVGVLLAELAVFRATQRRIAVPAGKEKGR